LGLEDPVGSRLSTNAGGGNGGNRIFTVVGVVKDYHFQSLRDEITPLAIFCTESNGPGPNFLVAIRTESRNLGDLVLSVENLWNRLAVNNDPFKYKFLDESLEAQYRDEKRSGELFGIFAGLAIIIACVGLFGLAAYTAGLRTKEIGVRKVMGASVAQIVAMLSIEFTKLILIAFVLAVPMAWWGMDNWLNGFYYRTTLGISTFFIAGGSALLISWLTVSYQSIKAAIVNPVNSLRSE
jgi:putative ABC transport system permease protein